MKPLAIALLALTACASADSGGHVGGVDANHNGSGSGSDATVDIDAPIVLPIDAPPQPVQVVLTQSTSMTIDAASSFGCNQTNPQYTKANSYYRVFKLSDSGITTPFTLQKVSFAVQQALAGNSAADQPLQLKIGTYVGTEGGTTLPGTTTPINASSNLRVPNGNLTMVDVPFTDTIPAGASLIVELAIPDGIAAKNLFFVGTNGGGETKPGYIKAADCSVSTPTSMASIATANSLPPSDLIITVTGTH